MNREPKKKGLFVFVKDNENINQSLRRLKRKVEDARLFDELRDREAYVKPSIRRKKAKSAARARWLKKVRNEQLPVKNY